MAGGPAIMSPKWRFLSPTGPKNWALALSLPLLIVPIAPLAAQDDAAQKEKTPAQAAEVTGRLLIISASDFEGMPLPGVEFTISSPDSEETRTVTTNQLGEVEIPGVKDPDALRVKLANDQYLSATPQTVISASATILAWRLYRKDIGSMGADEREEFARALQDIVRNSPEPESLLGEKVRALTAFLAGGDRGSATPIPLEPREEEAQTGALSIRLIDGRGVPREGALVQLLSHQPSINSVAMIDHERTNDEGLAVFSDLELGRHYRAEVIEDGGLVARSTIVRLEGMEPLVLPTMILRPADQTISGIVADANDVAAGTLVTARRPSDGLMMTAASDSSGYFLLGPFSPGNEVTLTFEQSTSAGVRTAVMTARPGEGELLVPLHVLAER
jgi:hypothetical protein